MRKRIADLLDDITELIHHAWIDIFRCTFKASGLVFLNRGVGPDGEVVFSSLFFMKIIMTITTITYKTMMNSNLLKSLVPSHLSEFSWDLRLKEHMLTKFGFVPYFCILPRQPQISLSKLLTNQWMCKPTFSRVLLLV